MKKIPLTQGKYALVDDADFERLSAFKWYAVKDRNTFYAIRNSSEGGKRCQIRMHWLVLKKPPPGKVVDHINRNGLDNRRENLRICTKSQNQLNQDVRSTFWDINTKKWRAQIKIERKTIYLGCFSDRKEADRVVADRREKALV